MYAEVGSHAALLALQDESVVAQFRDALLRPLIEHDRRRHTELVRAIELFWSRAAPTSRPRTTCTST